MTNTRRHHTKAETFKLAEYTKCHYVASGMNDGDFAAQAAGVLGFPVTPRQLADARSIFSIPNNMQVLADQRKAEEDARRAEKLPANATLIARVQALEGALIELSKRLETVERFEFPKADAAAAVNGAAAH